MFKVYRISTLSVSLIMFVLGLILTIKPEMSVTLICYIIAGCFLVLSITRLISFVRLKKQNSSASNINLVYAIASVVIAAMIAMNPTSLANVIPVVLGIIIALNGAIIITSGLSYREFLPNRGIANIVFGAVLLILGIYSIAHSFEVQVILMRFLGVAMFISGGSNIINYILINRAAGKKKDATTVNFEVHKEK